MGTKKNNVGRSILAGVLLLALMVATGGIMGMYQLTLIHIAIPIVIFIAAGGLSIALLGSPSTFRSSDTDKSLFCRFWRWIFDSDSYALSAVAQFISTGVIVTLLFFLINFFARDKESLHSEKVRIERVYREKHYHTKRVGRRSYARGEPYYEHYIEVELPNNRRKPIHVSADDSRRLHKGDSVNVTLEKGGLGFTIFRKNSTDFYQNKKRKSRYRYEKI
ncbi:MAG: hypothetical protein K2G11_04925 [Muribaculaceae bacterium]|nr:hypothetical protein [Muribaculaceae bacterium]